MPDLSLASKIEAIIFVEAKVVSVRQLAKWLGVTPQEILEAAHQLADHFDGEQRGTRVLVTDTQVQLVAAPEMNELLSDIVKDERTGELTKPSLETLSIIAYRGPVSKAELEMIRGVNCTLILRNLMIRGLITERYDKPKAIDVYSVSTEYLQLLGVSRVQDLPDYEQLNRDFSLGETLGEMEDPNDFFNQSSDTTQDDTSKTK